MLWCLRCLHMRTQLHHVSGNIYLNEGGVNDDGRTCFCDIRFPSHFLSIRSYLLCYFAEVCGLYPVIVIAASCHPRLSRVSSSDRGAWIPPPAQRSVFQSLPPAAGHRHPLRRHQVVSLTIALCQQSSRVEFVRHV